MEQRGKQGYQLGGVVAAAKARNGGDLVRC